MREHPTHQWLAYVLALTLLGCAAERSQVCSSGILCPVGRRCAEPMGVCIASGEETALGIWARGDELWVVGVDGLLVHYDGRRWQRQWQDPLDPPRELKALWGDEENVYAVGEKGLVLHSDGSGRWSAVPQEVITEDLNSLWGTEWSGPEGPQKGVYVLPDYIANTIARCGRLSCEAVEILDGASITERLGIWASGDQAVIVGVDGSVVHWKKGSTAEPKSAVEGVQLEAVWGLNASDLYAVGEGGTIVHYDGSAWQLLPKADVSTDADLVAIWGDSNGNIYAVGEEGVAVVRENGRWSVEEIPTEDDLVGVSGNAAGDVFTVAQPGDIWRRRNGRWTRLP